MFICDSHLHTINSFDGQNTLDDICAAALEKGLSEISPTEHCDIDCILDGIYPKYDEAAIRDAIAEAREKYAGKLTISHGIELGQAHLRYAEAAALIERSEHDFVLGSLHNLPDVPDFSLLKFEKMSMEQAVSLWERSLTEVEKLIRTRLIDSLAHVIYPIRYITLAGKKLDLTAYYPRLSEIFGYMVENGIALEINTSGIRQGLGFTLPDRDILALYVKCGGKMVTCGSDAHRTCDVGSDITLAYNMLKEVGLDYVTVFHKRKPEFVKIETEN